MEIYQNYNAADAVIQIKYGLRPGNVTRRWGKITTLSKNVDTTGKQNPV